MPIVGKVNQSAEARKERLAINLVDLDRIEPVVRSILISPYVNKNPADIVKADRDRMDEMAVIFTCHLLQAACICDTIRNKDRAAGQYPTRIYLQKREGLAWER